MAEVQVKTVEPMAVLCLPFTGPYDQTGEKVDEVIAWLLRAGHPYSGAPFAIYYDDPEKVAADKLRAEVCLPVEEKCEGDFEVARKEVPGCEVACAVHVGPYDAIKPLYGEIFAWIQQNGYKPVAELGCREVFKKILGDVDTAAELETEIQVPVVKA